MRSAKWFVVVVLALIGSAAPAETFIFAQGHGGYTGFRDTTLFQDLPQNAGGGADSVFSGTIRTGFLRRALIAADLSAIPSGAVVTSVRFELGVSRSGGNFGDVTYGLYRLTRDWGEGDAQRAGEPGGNGAAAGPGDATWNAAHFPDDPWTVPGGDFAGSPSAVAAAGQEGDRVAWESAGLVADVQAWVDGTLPNHGWIVIAQEEGSIQRVKRFHASEAPDQRPRLVVETRDAGDGEGEGDGCWLKANESLFQKAKNIAGDLLHLAGVLLTFPRTSYFD